ncbi:porin [Formosimonas limnophila]|uniref:Porin n=1 Tax=Formosimonas limnophila TaxID=1384487 RepID=A0A8J3G0F4_9BURK|nr:porin [Formosimonas limnophila]GHA69307.1 porin [Formosimonas limnophila]
MKKTLIAVSLLSAFGVAQAETSVSLYGRINVAVEKRSDAGLTMKAQEYRYASHVGITGKEDLGKGYSAIFKLEAELEPDTGSGTYGSDKKQFGFNRHAYVGLVTPFGAFRFGRSTTPIVNLWVGGGFSDGRGIGEFTGGVAGTGLRSTQPEAAARWNNALFYDIKKGGLTAGLAITTKGSQSIVPTRQEAVLLGTTTVAPVTLPVDNEGADGSKPAYGAYARYEGKTGMWGYKLGAAYQVDNGTTYSSFIYNAAGNVYTNNANAPAEGEKTWLVASSLSYGPVNLDIGYAKVDIDNTSLPTTGGNSLLNSSTATNISLRTADSKTLFASIGYEIDPKNKVYFSYGRYKRTNNYTFRTNAAGTALLSGVGELDGSQYSIGYEHRLSKRTVIYANARKVGNLTNSCTAKTAAGANVAEGSATYVATCGASKEIVDSVLRTEKDYSYDIGISHSF